MNRNLLCSLVLTSFALGRVCFPAHAADQPQWGQAWSRNMVSREKGLPESFDPQSGRNLLWSAELGTETHSSPVVARGRVYIGTNNGHPRDPAQQGDRGVLMCFDEKTGRFLWQLVFPKRNEDIYFDWPNSGIASPVTVQGDRVYFVNNRGVVLCFEPPPIAAESAPNAPAAAPGPKTLWQFDLTSGAGIWSHDAAHSSILIHGDYLYLNSGTGVDNTHKRIRTPNAPSLVVLDKHTGRLVARDNEHIAPNIFHCTWSAPSLATVNGRPLIFFAAGNGIVYAFETVQDRGKLATLLSRIPALPHPIPLPSSGRSGNSTSTLPLPRSTCTNTTATAVRARATSSACPSLIRTAFMWPAAAIWWGKNEAWLKCIDATRTGDLTTNGLVWSYPLRKHVLSTPAIYHGLAFIADCGPTLHCLDAQTGQPYWTHELQGEAWASPLVADGKVYLGTRGGSFYVFAASKEEKLFSTVELGRPISSTAAAANGVLYVATMTHLYALRQGARP